MAAKPPYFRLSSFYFFYFAALGAFVPYWSIYLKVHFSFSSLEIGELLAIFMATKLIAPLAWGWLADHFNNRLWLIRFAAVMTVISFMGVYLYSGYWWMAGVMVAFGFFWNASLPLYEALTLNHLGSKVSRYSQIRLWGSIGFILMVAGLPLVIDGYSISALPHYILLMFIVVVVSTWLIKDKPHHIDASQEIGLEKLPVNGMLLAFLAACVLQTASHGAYYTFFSIYLEDHGYSRFYAGLMWALGVAAEVGLFIVLYRFIERFSVHTLFSLSLLVTAVRWVILGVFVDSSVILAFSQLLHATSYGLFHASAIHLIHHWYPGRSQGRGQALYAGLSFGLGGAVGSLLSGYLWEAVTTRTTFLLMAGFALLGWLVAIIFVREVKEDDADVK